MKNRLKISFPKLGNVPKKVIVIQNPLNRWLLQYLEARENGNTAAAAKRYADLVA